MAELTDDEKQHGERPKFTGRSGEPHAEFVPIVLRRDPIFVEYNEKGELVVSEWVSQRELDAARAFFRERGDYHSNPAKSTAQNTELVKTDPKLIESVVNKKPGSSGASGGGTPPAGSTT